MRRALLLVRGTRPLGPSRGPASPERTSGEAARRDVHRPGERADVPHDLLDVHRRRPRDPEVVDEALDLPTPRFDIAPLSHRVELQEHLLPFLGLGCCLRPEVPPKSPKRKWGCPSRASAYTSPATSRRRGSRLGATARTSRCSAGGGSDTGPPPWRGRRPPGVWRSRTWGRADQ